MNKEDVIKAARTIMNFCQEHNRPHRECVGCPFLNEWDCCELVDDHGTPPYWWREKKWGLKHD